MVSLPLPLHELPTTFSCTLASVSLSGCSGGLPPESVSLPPIGLEWCIHSIMSLLGPPPPPPYSSASNSDPRQAVDWNSHAHQLAWYRQQCCVFGNLKAIDSSLLEIVINDRTGTGCIGSSQRLNGLLKEQLVRPPRVRVRIQGTHYGLTRFGSQTDFDIWIHADWFVDPKLSSETPTLSNNMIRNADVNTFGSTQTWADWVLEDYGRTKAWVVSSQELYHQN